MTETSLGEQLHDGTHCHNEGEPHLGPCVDPEGPGFTREDVRRYAEHIAGNPAAGMDVDPRDLFAAAAVLGGLAQHGRLLPEPAEVRTEYGVWWHAGDSDGIRLDQERLRSPEEAHEEGRSRIGQYDITRYTVHWREHRMYADGSSWSGPWVPA